MVDRNSLTCIFHTRTAGAEDPAYRDGAGDVVGRVPSRGGVLPLPAAYEISGLNRIPQNDYQSFQ